MKINRKFFPPKLLDNEINYFAQLEGIICSVDELSTLQITKTPTTYNFRLAPSLPKYNNMLIEELLNFHNLFRIRLDMSKSIKSSGTINFKINLQE